MSIPLGVHPRVVIDPYTGEIVLAHYLEVYGNYIHEHFVPSEFIKARGGVIRSVKHPKSGHVIRLGFWDGIDGRHRYSAIVEILHPLDPTKKCRLREILKATGLFDELMHEGYLSDSVVVGYRTERELWKIAERVIKEESARLGGVPIRIVSVEI